MVTGDDSGQLVRPSTEDPGGRHGIEEGLLGSIEAIRVEMVQDRPEIVERVAGERTRLDGIVLVTVVWVGLDVVVMGRVIEPNELVSRLPVVRVLRRGEPDVEEPIVEKKIRRFRGVSPGSRSITASETSAGYSSSAMR